MLEDGQTWFLVADGRKARVLSEQRRGATLQELGDWSMSISEEDTYDPQDRPPRSHASVGTARHAVDKGSLHEKEEINFLKRLADRVGDAAKHNAFDHLVIAAPPRALGELRSLLPDAVQSRIRAELHKDIVSEDAPKLRERLTELLRG